MPRHRHSEPATRPHPATPPRRLSPRRLHPPWHASAPGNRHARGRSPPRPRRHRPCRVSRRCCRRTARRPTSPPAASVSPFMRWTASARPGTIAATPRPSAQSARHKAPGRCCCACRPSAASARPTQRHCRQDRLARALRHRLDGRRAGARLARAHAETAAAAPPPPEEPVPDPVAEAEQYAVIYPQRAARLPQPCDFGPPRPSWSTPSSPAPAQPSEPCLSHPQGHETSMRFRPPTHVRAQNNVLACRDVLPNPARRGALKPHA